LSTPANRSAAGRPAWWLPAVLGFGLFAPALALPLHFDDFHTLYWARASTFDPRWLWYNWYGGIFGRLLPKLIAMAGMATVGPRHEAYELVSLLLHVANVLLIGRLALDWTGSRRTASMTALLFAVGGGFYGKAVIRISNLAMILSLTLTLWALVEWQARRRWRGILLWLATLATHEVTVFAPVLLLFAPDVGAPPEQARQRWRTGLVLGALAVAALAAWLPGPAGRTAARLVSYPAFMLFPANLGTALDFRAAGAGLPLAFVRFLVEHRFAVGLAVLPLLAFALTRGAVARFAVAWMYLTWLPAVLGPVFRRSHDWQDARYLIAPAVGTCLLAGWLLDRIKADRPRRLMLAGIAAWSLLLTGSTFSQVWRHVGRDTQWPPIEQRFREDLLRLERTHTPCCTPEDWGHWS
jgi:hypothetical protein